MKCQIQPMAAITTAGTTMIDIAKRYPFKPCHACRKLPDPAQTARGMMQTMAASMATVFRKVSIPA